MTAQTATQTAVFTLNPIGVIHNGKQGCSIEVDPAFRPGLKQLGHFSHVIVLWWARELDLPEYRTLLQGEPPYAPGVVTGVFATRAPYRPNPVALTVCQILEVDEDAGILKINNIDAFDGTPLIDLKAYFPVCDRVRAASIPAWLEGWPEWAPDEGLGLED